MHVGAMMSSGHPKTTEVLLNLSFHFVVKYACLEISLHGFHLFLTFQEHRFTKQAIGLSPVCTSGRHLCTVNVFNKNRSIY